MNVEFSRANDDLPPRLPVTVWIERLFFVFVMSFALDYRATDNSTGGGGGGMFQFVFLAVALASAGGIVLLGWRYIPVRPGVWPILATGLFLGFSLLNAPLQGVDPGRSLRMLLPLLLCFAALLSTHIAACSGVRASTIVRFLFIASCVNILWRILHGFLFKEVSLETVRVEVQSPSSNWIAAWLGCALLLRGRFHWSVLLAFSVLFTGILITITRSLLFPILASAVSTSLCFFLGCRWRAFSPSELWKKSLPVVAVCSILLLALGISIAAYPRLIERWNERLFHNISERNLSADISYLTRKAEADAIRKILSDDPVHLFHGKGLGASYYWDPAYLPEIAMVFPADDLAETTDIWNIGHSTWTYSLFSGGVVSLLFHLIFFVSIGWLSLRSARANASDPGPDYWLSFLPFVALCCILSETITSDPLHERLAGLTFGIMAGLPQAFFIRSSWLHTIPAHIPGK